MDDITTKPPATPDTSARATSAPITHAEPTTGGSYTRNPATGALVKNATPAAQPAKE